MASAHSATATKPPKASHDQEGWWRKGDQRNMSAMPAIASNNPIGQRMAFQIPTAVPGPERRGDGMADRDGGEGGHDECSCADGENQGSTVLPECWTVLLDTVKTVEPTLDLSQERAGRDRRRDHEADQ